ncbi:hypothetical protein APICC_05568 [Apis cerana cerana]|uniref:Uncharacterized protein n=1 Tax=Apis cerana cerana TaxID=94128 RepID=A0A2A3EK59_APICC|nr:hypothetical protein APICC_05568 [Apis cerana cerana]
MIMRSKRESVIIAEMFRLKQLKKISENENENEDKIEVVTAITTIAQDTRTGFWEGSEFHNVLVILW